MQIVQHPLCFHAEVSDGIAVANKERPRPSVAARCVLVEVRHAEPGAAIVDVVVEQLDGCLLAQGKVVHGLGRGCGFQVRDHLRRRLHQHVINGRVIHDRSNFSQHVAIDHHEQPGIGVWPLRAGDRQLLESLGGQRRCPAWRKHQTRQNLLAYIQAWLEFGVQTSQQQLEFLRGFKQVGAVIGNQLVGTFSRAAVGRAFSRRLRHQLFLARSDGGIVCGDPGLQCSALGQIGHALRSRLAKHRSVPESLDLKLQQDVVLLKLPDDRIVLLRLVSFRA
ncbi:hypothetical protein D3C81_1205150 [compost metagenome]